MSDTTHAAAPAAATTALTLLARLGNAPIGEVGGNAALAALLSDPTVAAGLQQGIAVMVKAAISASPGVTADVETPLSSLPVEKVATFADLLAAAPAAPGSPALDGLPLELVFALFLPRMQTAWRADMSAAFAAGAASAKGG